MVLGGVVVSTDIVGGANQVVGDIYLGSFFFRRERSFRRGDSREFEGGYF